MAMSITRLSVELRVWESRVQGVPQKEDPWITI